MSVYAIAMVDIAAAVADSATIITSPRLSGRADRS